MSDENNNGRKPLTLKPRSGGSVSSGTVKQSFSHGRTKTVVVETKRARPHAAVGGNLAAPSAAERRQFEPPRPSAPQGGRAGAAGDGLSPEERAARQRVIEAARRQQAQQEAERRAREERARAEAEAARAAQAAQAAQAAKAAQPAEPEAPKAAAPSPAPAAPAAPTTTPPVQAAQPTPRPTSSEAASRTPAPGQTRTYQPSPDRRDDRPTTTT